MDETPSTAALDARRRRLLFRATHRGTRENDLLVGGFVAERIGAFTEQDMAAVEAILELPDPLVFDWLMGAAPLPDGLPMLALMRAAVNEGKKNVLS